MAKISERDTPLTAMDGSPMPTQALPTLNKTEEALLAAMEDYEPHHPPTQTCIYGNVGTGKTISGMEMLWEVVDPEMYILYVYTANGWVSINNHPKYWGRINGQRRLKTMMYENQEQLIALAKAIKKGAPPFNKIGGVMFDEYTHMIEQDQQWIVDARVEQAKKEQKFKDPFVPALPDYLGSTRRAGDIMDAFTKLNIHLMFIGHERIHEKTSQFVPDFGDKTSKKFFRVLHSVYFADVKKRHNGYVKDLSIHPDKRYVAKNRIGGLPGPTATIEEIVEAYKKWGMEEETEQHEENAVLESDNEITNLEKLLD